MSWLGYREELRSWVDLHIQHVSQIATSEKANVPGFVGLFATLFDFETPDVGSMGASMAVAALRLRLPRPRPRPTGIVDVSYSGLPELKWLWWNVVMVPSVSHSVYRGVEADALSPTSKCAPSHLAPQCHACVASRNSTRPFNTTPVTIENYRYYSCTRPFNTTPVQYDRELPVLQLCTCTSST